MIVLKTLNIIAPVKANGLWTWQTHKINLRDSNQLAAGANYSGYSKLTFTSKKKVEC